MLRLVYESQVPLQTTGQELSCNLEPCGLWKAPKFSAASVQIKLPKDFLCTKKQNKFLANTSASSHYFLTTEVGKQPGQKGIHKEIFYEEINANESFKCNFGVFESYIR